MFIIHCRRCRADVLVGDSQLLSLHRVSTGFVAYARCVCGRTGIAEIDGPASMPLGETTAAGPFGLTA